MRKLSLKWFGSLSNLSFRRTPEKGDSKSPLKHHGSLSEASSVEKSADDMDLCPHSPGYARSSDMYTHMGTMPRPSLKKKEKSLKGSKKGKGKSELSRRQSQRQAADYVCESPLLMALSTQTIQNLEAAPKPQNLEATPRPQSLEAAPLPQNTEAAPEPQNMVADPRPLPSPEIPLTSQPSQEPSNDIYVKMNPSAESMSPPKQPCSDPPGKPALPGKRSQLASPAVSVPTATPIPTAPSTLSSHLSVQQTANGECLTQGQNEDLLARLNPVLPPKETCPGGKEEEHSDAAKQDELQVRELEAEYEDSDLGSMDSRGEYVKFSKEKYLLDSPPEKLRKELEEELKLSSSDMRSHGWYHGHIPREVSETLVLRNGDFLIRDSLTSVGDYVLTSRWNHEVLHFKISKVLVKTNESRVQYLLERESFDSVPALVRYYVSNRRTVSQQSGAQIYCPINRTLPLRYLEATSPWPMVGTAWPTPHPIKEEPTSRGGVSP
ncbi:hypothetical protein AGOR_G00009280 [Albula goreensis]|uniref:SH2 domain-containing protein n=1 Tax=Albula goreensis TaxID=1534307 RepID=A0A8T3E9Z3_9TELE|nr:hypothetical protein AGOR_G00009280 [Albula goreensis]